jgi:tetratricopeptide (TPR) repeat protein
VKKAFICLLLAAIAVSAQQKQRVAVLPSVGDMEPQGLIILTDKVREIATKNLPIDNFTILKQDVIINMIGEEELYRSCKEGVCIGDLAKKTNANYGARCDVMKFDNRLVLKFELYSVNEEGIFETFTDINVKNFSGMIASLEARLPDVFKKMANASKSREVTPEAKPESPPAKTNVAASEQLDLNMIIERYEKMLKICETKKIDRCADVMYTLGALYYDQAKASTNDYSKSLKMYWLLAREYPTFPKLPEAYFQMSVTYLHVGYLDSTRIVLEQLVARFPNSPRVSAAHFRLADLAFMDNNYNKAYQHLMKVKKDQVDTKSWEITQNRLAQIKAGTVTTKQDGW